QTLNSGGDDFYNLTISSTCTYAVQVEGNDLTVGNNLIISTNAVLDLKSNDLIVSGPAISNKGTLKLTGSQTQTNFINDTNFGTVEYYGNDNYAQLAAGDNYYNLIINSATGTGSWRLDNPLDVNGNFTIAIGTIITGDNSLDIEGNLVNSGTLTLANNTVNIAGNWINLAEGSFNCGESTVIFDGTTTQTLNSGGDSFFGLTISNTYLDGVYVSSSPLTVTGNLTISLDSILDIGGENLIATGAEFSNDGTLRLEGGQSVIGLKMDTDSGTVEYYGDGGYELAAGYEYWNLVIASTAIGGYKRPITIINTGSAVVDYQVKIILNSNNFDFVAAASDGRDIRILDSDETTLLDYWIESYNPTAKTAVVWVKVPNIPNGSKKIYVSYGNPSLTSESNYNTTFSNLNTASGSISGNWSLNYTLAQGRYRYVYISGRYGIYGSVSGYNPESGWQTLYSGGGNGNMINTNYLFQYTQLYVYLYRGYSWFRWNGWDTWLSSSWNVSYIQYSPSVNFPSVGDRISSGFTVSGDNTLKVNNNLTISKGTLELSQGNAKVKGDVAISKGGELSAPSAGREISIGGSYQNAGLFTHNNGTVVFDAAATGKIITSGFSSFYDLKFDGTGGAWSLTDSLDVENNLSIVSGSLTAGSNPITIANDFVNQGTLICGSNSVTVGGNFNNQGTAVLGSSLDIDGNFTQDAGSFTAPSGNFYLAGNFTNSGGTFIHNNGTVVFDDVNKVSTIRGETVFYNFISVTPKKYLYFEAGSLQTMDGVLTLKGQSGALIVLRSTNQTGTDEERWWRISPQSYDIKFVNVKDSKNEGPKEICAITSRNSGNNIRWVFPTANLTWDGSDSSLWGDDANWSLGYMPNPTDNATIPDASTINYSPSLDDSRLIRNLTINAGGILDLAGYNFTLSGIFQNYGVLKLEGGETLDFASFDSDSGVVEYYGDNAVYGGLCAGGNYNDLLFSGTAVYNLDSALDVNGDLTIESGKLAAGGYSINIGGSFINSGVFTTSGTVIFDALNSNETITSGGASFNDLEFNGAGSSWLLQDPLDVNGSLTIGSGTLDLNGENLDLTGAGFENTGTLRLIGSEVVTIPVFDANSGAVEYYGDSSYDQLAAGDEYYDLTFSGEGFYKLDDNLIVQGSLNISNPLGILDLNSYGLSLAGDFYNLGTLRLLGSEDLIGFINDDDSGTVEYYGDDIYTHLAAEYAYYNLTFTGGGSYRLGDNLTVAGDLSIVNPQGVLDLAGYNLILAAASRFFNQGTLELIGSETLTNFTNDITAGTVKYYGVYQYNYLAAKYSYYNLTISTTTGSFTAVSDLEVRGDFTLSGGTFTAPSGNFSLGGNFNRAAGTFNHNQGTIIFIDAGKASTIYNSNTFYNFTCQTPGKKLIFEAGKTQNIEGAFILTGSSGAGKLIVLRSTADPDGLQWLINPQGSRDINYVDVKDSHNIHFDTITAYNSANRGNNINWTFAIVTLTWNGGALTANWADDYNWDKGFVPNTGDNIIIPEVVGNNRFYPVLQRLTKVNNLTISHPNASLDLAGFDFILTGAFINQGTLLLKGSEVLTGFGNDITQGTVKYYGNELSYAGLAAGDEYYNLIFAGEGIYSLDNTLIVNGNLTISQGVLDLAGQIVIFDADSEVFNDATLKLIGSENIINFPGDTNSGTIEYYGGGIYDRLAAGKNYHNLKFSGGGNYWLNNNINIDGDFVLGASTVINTAGKVMYIAGNFTNQGGRLEDAGTVVFDGSGESYIYGETSFYHFICQTPGKVLYFQAGSTQIINGLLSLKGQSGNLFALIKLRSTEPGTPWYINPIGPRDVYAVDVKDSYNTIET
ncbi:MAG: DUF2341 domain-containing protein, partial [Candidatus Omnitrophica bacterium]|nr:DUF2341 domain-containing protein [Candidatus Omnitrophota bacterium]